MTTADVVSFASYGVFGWLAGYACGYVHGFIRRTFRHAADFS